MIALPARTGRKDGPSFLGFEEPQTLYDNTPNDDLESFEKMFNYAKKSLMEALMLDKSRSSVSFIFFEINVVAVCAETIESRRDMPGQGQLLAAHFKGENGVLVLLICVVHAACIQNQTKIKFLEIMSCWVLSMVIILSI